MFLTNDYYESLNYFICIIIYIFYYFNHKCRVVSAAIPEGEDVYLTTLCIEA